MQHLRTSLTNDDVEPINGRAISHVLIDNQFVLCSAPEGYHCAYKIKERTNSHCSGKPSGDSNL